MLPNREIRQSNLLIYLLCLSYSSFFFFSFSVYYNKNSLYPMYIKDDPGFDRIVSESLKLKSYTITCIRTGTLK